MLTGTFGEGAGYAFRWAFSDRSGGGSLPPYDARNLGGHVGDDPAAVGANRAGVAAETRAGTRSARVHGPGARRCRADRDRTPDRRGARLRRPGDRLAGGGSGGDGGRLCTRAAGRRHRGRARRRPRRPSRCAERHRGAGGADHVRSRCADRPHPGPARPGRVRRLLRGAAGAERGALPRGARRGGPHTGRHARLDLRRGLAGVLRGLGVADVERVGPCTRESPEFFSARRANGTPTGRFAGFAWRTPTAA